MSIERLSAHFARTEFKCHHCGKSPEHIEPALITGLEALRAVYFPKGLVIVSGWRCPEYQAILHKQNPANAASDSQHPRGAAADVGLVAPLAGVIGLRVFSGIGWQRIGSKALVRHVDVRHVSSKNTTGGTVARPTLWEYR